MKTDVAIFCQIFHYTTVCKRFYGETLKDFMPSWLKRYFYLLQNLAFRIFG